MTVKMAGEIEEPLKLDFKAASLHSGSISFGRFESEALCWERRSSFSHNRYLEEVEKCSKPGLVTEKKAYFEAHFRKRGILGLCSPGSQIEAQYQTSDNDRSVKTGYDEKISHMNSRSDSLQFDESLNGSRHGSEHEIVEQESQAFGSSNSDDQVELLCDSTNNVDCFSEHGDVEAANQAKFESVLLTHSRSEIEVKENFDDETEKSDTSNISKVTVEENSIASRKGQQGSSCKEKLQSQTEYVKPKLGRRVRAAQSIRPRSSKESSKGSEKIPSETVHNVLMRSKYEKMISEASAHDKCPMQKTPKHEPGSTAKDVNEIKRGEKEPRNRAIRVPQSTLQKLPGRVRQSENRIKPAVGATQQCIKQDGSRLRFKCNDHAERRKEFDMKLEVKMHAKTAQMHQPRIKCQEKKEAETKQLRKSLNFKATPLPSFYNGVLRNTDRNKAVASNIQPQNPETKFSRTGSRVLEGCQLSSKSGKGRATLSNATPKTSDPAQASGGTSCHSTVTSDSSPLSPAAEMSKAPNARAVVGLLGRERRAWLQV